MRPEAPGRAAPPAALVADQAMGLRRLFTPQGAVVVPVVAAAGERPGAAALALARAVNAAGRRCLVIDATRGEVSRALGLAARYDLSHAAAGDRRLADVILDASPGLRILPASRGLAELARSPGTGARLARLAGALGLREDWILVAADESTAEASSVLAAGAEVAIACRTGIAGRTAAYALMKRIARSGAAGGFRLFVAAHGRAETAGRELACVVEDFLGIPAAYAATIPAADAQRLSAQLASWRCARVAPAQPEASA